MKLKSRKKERKFVEKKKCFVDGFSLVEFVVVFLVLAVVSGVSAPVFFKKSLNFNLRALYYVSEKCDVSKPPSAAFYY